jgi:hypothetical protein
MFAFAAGVNTVWFLIMAVLRSRSANPDSFFCLNNAVQLRQSDGPSICTVQGAVRHVFDTPLPLQYPILLFPLLTCCILPFPPLSWFLCPAFCQPDHATCSIISLCSLSCPLVCSFACAVPTSLLSSSCLRSSVALQHFGVLFCFLFYGA